MTVASIPMKSPLTRSMPLAAPASPRKMLPPPTTTAGRMPCRADLGDIGGYGFERGHVDAVAPASHESLARDFNQRTLVGQWRHVSSKDEP